MQNLTEKIFSLDKEATLAIKDAKLADEEAKKSADMYAEKKLKEVQQLFEKEKENEVKALEKSLEEEKKHARVSLVKKTKSFDEQLNIDAVVDDLVSMVKGQICP